MSDLVIKPITVYSYGSLLNCTTVGQTSDKDDHGLKLSAVRCCPMRVFGCVHLGSTLGFFLL